MQTSSSYVRLEGSTIGTLGMVDGGGHQVVLDGYNKPYRIYAVANTNGSGTVFISSGAVVDFTGNALASPITPGVGVTFAPGGAQVYPSAGMADASYIDNLTFATVGNNKLFGLGGTSNAIPAGSSAFASNAIISGGTTTYGGCCNIGGTVEMSGCSVVNCSANGGGAFMAANAGKILLTSTVVSGCSASTRGGAIYIQNGGSAVLNHSDVGANSAPYAPVCLGGSNCYLEIDNSTTGLVYSVDAGGHSYRIRGNCSITQIRAVAGAGGDVTIEGGAVIALTYYITPGGTITVQTGGCTVNGHSIAAGTYTSIQSDGSTTAA